MTVLASDRNRSYGALELKRSYQFGLILALLGAVALHLGAIGGARLYGHLTGTEPPPTFVPDDGDRGFVVLQPPPTVVREDPPPSATVAGARPDFFIPVPVPDEQVTGGVLLPAQREKSKLAVGAETGAGSGRTPGQATGGFGDGLVDNLPPPDKFVPFEQPPEPIRRVMPEYPPLARATGLSGVVVLKILVDQKGIVRNALIARATDTDAGFEEAALEAIRRWLFRPAINNGQSVAVWIYLPIRFELE